MPDSYATIEQRLSGTSRYVSDDAVLRLTVYNAAAGVTVTLSGRRLDCEGRVVPFVHRLVPTTDRVATTLDVPLNEGWLLGLQAAVTAGTPLAGQTYATLSLGRGRGVQFTELETFAAGTITAAHRLGWPGGHMAGPLDAAGAVRAIVGTVPAAGASFSETVPTGARWELIAVTASLTTAVAVANRVVTLTVDDGAATLWIASPQQVQAASLAWQYFFGRGSPTQTVSNRSIAMANLPVGLVLPSGARVRSDVTALQAADQWDAPRLLVREWIEGA